MINSFVDVFMPLIFLVIIISLKLIRDKDI